MIPTNLIVSFKLPSYLFLRAYIYAHTTLNDDETEEEFVLTYKKEKKIIAYSKNTNSQEYNGKERFE